MVYTKARRLGALFGIRNGCCNILDKFTSKFTIFFALKAETAEPKKKSLMHYLFYHPVSFVRSYILPSLTAL